MEIIPLLTGQFSHACYKIKKLAVDCIQDVVYNSVVTTAITTIPTTTITTIRTTTITITTTTIRTITITTTITRRINGELTANYLPLPRFWMCPSVVRLPFHHSKN
jgi:hypothetical protein